MNKFTEGPWIANDRHSDSNHPWRIESDANGYPNDGWVVALLDGPDAEANAKLIAAAPDLLQELRNIAKAKPETWDDPGDFRAWAQSRARHTLSKAGLCDDDTNIDPVTCRPRNKPGGKTKAISRIA